MGKKVLIAEAREVVRVGLCTVFQNDARVSEVLSATTHEELRKHLSSRDFDFAVISQLLINDIKQLPEEKCVLLVDEPDLSLLTRAYEQRMLGYISCNITAEFLKAMLRGRKDSFFIDPMLLPWIMEHLSETKKRSSELHMLSPREREVASLLNEGLDRHTVARQLHISEATLKTHIKNIARKQEDARWSEKVLVYQRRLKGS